MGEFGPWHLLILAGVFVVLFGAKKLPDAARSLGKSARILKTELKDLHDDDPKPTTTVQQVEAVPVATPVAAPAPLATPVATPVAPATETVAQPVSAGDQSTTS